MFFFSNCLFMLCFIRHSSQYLVSIFESPTRAVARSEILGGLVVLGGDTVYPLVEIGLADLPNIGRAKAGGLKPPSPYLATAL